LLKRTEAMGLITRRRDTQDERVVRIVLTDGGRQMAQDIACAAAGVGGDRHDA
jgi:DNA-binding MarR family transcriptional regulator